MTLFELHSAAKRMRLTPEQVLLVYIDHQYIQVAEGLTRGSSPEMIEHHAEKLLVHLQTLLLLQDAQREVKADVKAENLKLVWDEDEG